MAHFNSVAKSINSQTTSNPVLPTILTRVSWLFFILTLVLAYFYSFHDLRWEWQGLLKIDGLTVVMWLAVTFFIGIVDSFSKRYMAVNHYINQFFLTKSIKG